MPSISPRTAAKIANYAGSPLQELNDARRLAAALNPLRAEDPRAQPYAANNRVTLLQELIGESAKVDELCGDYEAYLMLDDAYNPGEFTLKAIYDYAAEPCSTGEFFVDVHEGQALLKPSTLVYWK